MTIHEGWTMLDHEFDAGYRDGGDPTAPEPSGNRHPAYRHSFAVRRAEMAGQPIPAAVSRAAADAIVAEEETGGPSCGGRPASA